MTDATGRETSVVHEADALWRPGAEESASPDSTRAEFDATPARTNAPDGQEAASPWSADSDAVFVPTPSPVPSHFDSNSVDETKAAAGAADDRVDGAPVRRTSRRGL